MNVLMFWQVIASFLYRLQLYELIERKVQGDGNCQVRFNFNLLDLNHEIYILVVWMPYLRWDFPFVDCIIIWHTTSNGQLSCFFWKATTWMYVVPLNWDFVSFYLSFAPYQINCIDLQSTIALSENKFFNRFVQE